MVCVVTKACFGCKYTDCVKECPVDAFREGEHMLYIDPDVCIGCDACIAVCPVEAIYDEFEVPAELEEFIALNAEMAPQCPTIVEKKAPLC